ncbi:MAG: tryptophan synthase subunit alpha [Spirochaetota bacterium]
MAHLVAHYPDVERSLAVARGLIRGGAAFLEIQFPFSDPTADGPVIQEACQKALDGGFTVDAGFEFVRAVADEARRAAHDGVGAAGDAQRTAADGGATGAPSDAVDGIPIFIMTYASLLYARGVETFMRAGVDSGAAGFILPDVPLDYDEGTWAAAEKLGTRVMPVTVTTAREQRIRLITGRSPEYVYVALRRGITGERTEIGEDNVRVLDRLRTTGAKVMAGFGIAERDQVVALEPHVHAAVLGSAFVRTVAARAHEPSHAVSAALREQTAALVGAAS